MATQMERPECTHEEMRLEEALSRLQERKNDLDRYDYHSIRSTRFVVLAALQQCMARQSGRFQLNPAAERQLDAFYDDVADDPAFTDSLPPNIRLAA